MPLPDRRLGVATCGDVVRSLPPRSMEGQPDGEKERGAGEPCPRHSQTSLVARHSSSHFGSCPRGLRPPCALIQLTALVIRGVWHSHWISPVSSPSICLSAGGYARIASPSGFCYTLLSNKDTAKVSRKRCGCLPLIASAQSAGSIQAQAASISVAARRPDSSAPCIQPRSDDACSPAKWILPSGLAMCGSSDDTCPGSR